MYFIVHQRMISCGSHSRDSLRNLCMAVPSFFERGWKEKSLFCFFSRHYVSQSKFQSLWFHGLSVAKSSKGGCFFPKIFFTLKWFPKSEIHGSCVVQFQITNMYLVQIHCVWKKKKRIHCSELSKFVDVILKIAFQRKFTCSLGTCHSRSAQNDSEFCH